MARSLVVMITTMITVALLMGVVSAAAVSADKGKKGCTPGYWKNHHPGGSAGGSWPTGYYNDLFNKHFENAFPGMTLDAVLHQGGGDLNALGRHTVAALLNAAALGDAFHLTTTEVINMFNGVFPGGDYEGLKDTFEDYNSHGCPF
jgi:hypothetical protein